MQLEKKPNRKKGILKDIKDRSPNENLIKQLEKMLDEAKKGELRSMICLQSWDDDAVSHSWVLDKRNQPRLLIGEFIFLIHNFVVNTEMKEQDSVLYDNLFN